jgi:hypothetical protein|tara:strand:- start:43 stop:234 length:192 start_codon:yes stop_codon:yes gene_type:complete
MTITYKFYKPDPDFPEVQNIKKLEDGKVVCDIPNAEGNPDAEGNVDYQEWVEWAKSNQTEAAN